MSGDVRIESINADNVEQLGFFCYKSKRRSEGYKRKLSWLKARLAEGMRIRILSEGRRSFGFVEYIPGEYAWRAIEATDYLVIHCLWIVGRGKGKGYGSRLLEMCIEGARQEGRPGVAILTSNRTWLTPKRIFQKFGFEQLDTSPPAFELMALTLEGNSPPALPSNWDERAEAYGSGLTTVYTSQCPYIEASVRAVQGAAEQLGVDFRSVELTSSAEVRERSPSAYGVFGVVADGSLASYHPISTKHLLRRLMGRSQ